ncbi:hypothetical protein [Actinomadura sp. GTD37]|uniref:hypothetical protein n=1 Tax=Actinomadura sp. GTD37 TaxID=1778030 RepID=UPI0035C03913
MSRNTPQNRDELLVTGIPPVADPLPDSATATRPLPEAAPVFVDASGWRARFGRRLGLLTGALLVVFLGALGLGMTTGPDMPLTPWSEPSPHPRVKVSHPQVTPTRTAEPPAAARPQPTMPTTMPTGGPAPSAVPTPSSTPRSAPTGVTSTSHPGKSTAEPPAWGRKKKNS